MYTKFIIVVDDDVNIREWKEVIWALTTRVDAIRDTTLVDNTPIDYLDFASPVAGLGSKMGIDATNKWPGETAREWGRPIVMKRLAERGLGIAFQTCIGLERELAEGRLCHRLLNDRQLASSDLGAYVRTGRSLPPALDAFIRTVGEELGKRENPPGA